MALIFPSFSPVFGTFSNTTSGRKAHSFKCHSYKPKSFDCKWHCTYFCIFLQPLVSHVFEFHATQIFLKPPLKTFLKSLKLIKAQNNYKIMQKVFATHDKNDSLQIKIYVAYFGLFSLPL